MEEKPKRQLTEAQRLAFMKGREKRLANIEKRRQEKLEQEKAQPVKEEIPSIPEAEVTTPKPQPKPRKKNVKLTKTQEVLDDNTEETYTEQDDNKQVETNTSTSQDEHTDLHVKVEQKSKPKEIIDMTTESKYEIDHDLLADKIVSKMRSFQQQEVDTALTPVNEEEEDNTESKVDIPKKPKLKRAATSKQTETSQSSISKPRLGQPPQIIFNWM